MVASVRAKFAAAYPGFESVGASSANYYADSPPAEKPATAKPAEPPKPTQPTDPLDAVPRSAAEYGIPVPADAPPDLTPAMWQTLCTDALAAGLTTRQARSWASFADVKVLRRALEVGYDHLPLEQLATAAKARLASLKVPEDKIRLLLETSIRRLEAAEPRPVADVSELEDRQRELILHPAYYDRFDPKHKSVRAEAGRLAAEIVRKKPILLQD